MQFDQITAVIRPRNRWEAMDLGLQLARRDYLNLWLLWWLSALPVVLISGLLLWEMPFYLSILVWWFKPLYEPLMVFWLSRRLFAEKLTFTETRKHWWQITRMRLLPNLLWRRISLRRSLFMPVTVLERLSGKAWRERTRVLSGQDSGGVWLTVACVHFESILMYSLIAALYMLVPDSFLPDWTWQDWSDGENTTIAWVSAGLTIFAMSVIAPFYVAGGFALYLSRRTDLEAWDIELVFRRFLSAASQLLLPLLLLMPIWIAGTGSAEAETLQQKSDRVLQEVLSGEDFGGEEQISSWQLKSDSENESAERPDLSWLFDIEWQLLAQILEVLSWIAVFVLIAWLIAKILANYQGLRLPKVTKAASPIVAHLGVSEAQPLIDDHLPADIPKAVQSLLAEQSLREALSLLYRATLQSLSQKHTLEFPQSATEGECLSIAQDRSETAELTFFSQLTRYWVNAAYAEIVPSEDAIQSLLAQWQRLFSTERNQAS